MVADNELDERLLRRLDILILLALDREVEGGRATVTDKTHRLADLGISRGEIAEVIGKPTNYVSAVLSKKKR